MKGNNKMYPDYIMKNVRRALGREADDATVDPVIMRMEPIKVLREYWQWEGIIGFEEEILETVCDIFGIDLEERCFYDPTK